MRRLVPPPLPLMPQKNESEPLSSSPQPPPAFDSFAWLAIGLSIAVGAGSAYYFRKSKKQLEGTLKTLEGRRNP